MYQHTAKECVKMISIIVLSSLMTILLFNILMDPYDLFNTPENRRPVYLVNQSYLTKAVGIIHKKPNTIIIGSSIVDAGFMLPGSMLVFYDTGFELKQKRLQSLIQSKEAIYNAGIRGGGLYDIYNYIEHAYKNNPKLKHIIIGLEYGLFTYFKKAETTVPYTSALGKTYVPLNIYFNNLFSWHVIYDSWQTFVPIVKNVFRDFILNSKEHYIIESLYHSLKNEYNEKYPYLFNRFVNQYTSEDIMYNNIEEKLIKSRDPHETASLLFSVWQISSGRGNLDRLGPDSILDPKAFDCLRRIVNFAKERNIKLDVYISPQHGVYWKMVQKFGLQDYVDTWLKQFAQITPYWDFSAKVDFNSDVGNYFDTDALHFNYKVGEIILPTILQGSSHPPSGIEYVTKNNVNEVVNKRHINAAKWIKNNNYLNDVLSSPTFAAYGKSYVDLQELTIVEYHPTYKGYQIIKFFNNYMALPARYAPYDFKQLLTKKYPDMIESDSFESLISRINRA